MVILVTSTTFPSTVSMVYTSYKYGSSGRQNRAPVNGPVAVSTVFAPASISTGLSVNVARTTPSLSTTVAERVTFVLGTLRSAVALCT